MLCFDINVFVDVDLFFVLLSTVWRFWRRYKLLFVESKLFAVLLLHLRDNKTYGLVQKCCLSKDYLIIKNLF